MIAGQTTGKKKVHRNVLGPQSAQHIGKNRSKFCFECAYSFNLNEWGRLSLSLRSTAQPFCKMFFIYKQNRNRAILKKRTLGDLKKMIFVIQLAKLQTDMRSKCSANKTVGVRDVTSNVDL